LALKHIVKYSVWLFNCEGALLHPFKRLLNLIEAITYVIASAAAFGHTDISVDQYKNVALVLKIHGGHARNSFRSRHRTMHAAGEGFDLKSAKWCQFR
jgi:hypothetical protein